MLDTYHRERHPIGKRVLTQSGLMARGVTLRPRIARGMRNLIAPRMLRVPRVRDAVAGSVAGTILRYAHGSGQHPLAGTRAAEIPLRADKLAHIQRRPGFVLIRERETRPVGVPGLMEVERSDTGPAVLVRPDGYIAWVGDPSDRQAWLTVLHRWLGAGRSGSVFLGAGLPGPECG
ncbi:aromatic-ring hydroxylase C-terminal domain-containing protein [Mycobacterium sp. 2YAF39]|uniref:aromatic-ring hydroxylase C-terminal domain-containing protein n=1 Tax=Mycobacterium sp. 2YAF39 TaxID=3233033 RepID=UPI003F9A3B74